MPPTLQSARKHYRLSALIARRAVREARKARGAGATAVVTAVAAHQVTQAQVSQTAVAEMLAEQEIESVAEALLNSAAFASDMATAARMIEAASTDYAFDRLVESIVQNAGRAAESVSIAVRPDIYHVRYVNPPCCARCAILAGRVYRWSDGFQRHPNCFPAGTVVSGPRPDGASRRWYEGELVTVRTASGKQFAITGNHPVLTPQGWLPANLLGEGSYVISRSGGDRSRALVVPDHDQMPTRIEDVWRSDGMRSLGSVPVSAEDFHGDGVGSSHVDVVLADRLLRNRAERAGFKKSRQFDLAVGLQASVALLVARSGQQHLGSRLPAAPGLAGVGSLPLTLSGAHLLRSQQPSFAGMADGNFSLHEATTYHRPGEASSLRYGQLALSVEVGGDERGDIDRLPFDSRWDAPAVPFSHQNRGAYASRGLDLRHRLASDVTADRIVKFERVSWSGHVYNLTSSEGWFEANGIIVSNCDCSMIPTTVASPYAQDPDQLVADGQVRGLSKADLRAIQDGADLGKVVNVRRREAGLRDATGVIIRGGRPTPAGIYRIASDRAQAVELLRRYGYITS